MSKRSEEEWDRVVRARCRTTAAARCVCGRWIVSKTDVGKPCWTCRQKLELVGEMPPALVPLTPAERARQEELLDQARRELRAVPA